VIKDQPSFAAIVSQLKTLQPEGVFLFIYSDDGGRFLKEAQKQGLKTKFFATENFTGTKVVENAKDAVEGVMMVVPTSTEQSESYKIFEQKYTKRFNAKPTIFSIKGYDEVYVIYDIIKKSKSDVNQAKLLMKSYKGEGVSGKFAFDKTGEFVPGKYDRMAFIKVNDTYEPKVIEK
jgi:branched-chain amino acid transport system substrate-binding protein